ncbi:MAG TPA: D-2-hydroxyacid dehydrogenase [Pyrinomonadaceae bacterium]|nr:D-2-hydroxyacid dehydrogenase [Pyrinomonadaceae bacterium]
MERIVFLERNTIQADFRPPNFAHEWIDYPETADDQVQDRVREATIIVSNKLSLGETQLANAPQVRLIAIAATGSDCVDLNYCRLRGIAVCNVRGYAVNTVPEHVLMMILALRRNLLAYRTDVEGHLWNESKQFCLLTHELHDIRDSTLGIIGYGSIGRSVARLGESVGMRVLIAEREQAMVIREGRTAFADTLRQSDVLSLHCPLTEETRNLIGPDELRMMKRNALLINTARGALLDDDALIEALRQGIIAGAGLDVLREEPPRQGSRLLDLNLPNLIITPHVAWASREAVQILAHQVIDNLEGFIAGRPKNLLT